MGNMGGTPWSLDDDEQTTAREITRMKSGTQTTEFWLSVVVIAAATFLFYTGKITQDIWMLATGVQGAGYTIARGLAKMGKKDG